MALALVVAPMLGLAIYGASARWLLSGQRLRGWINAHPEKFLLDYDAATSVWPGHVTIRNLRIRGSDHNVQWLVELADARIEYSVGALLSRTFRCTRLTGTGLAFRLRRKLDAAKLQAGNAAFLPPIAGFSDPPLRPEGPVPVSEHRHPWLVDVRSIWLDHFDAIWFDAFHYQGVGRLRGRFLLRPGILAQIGPATVEFDRGELRIGDAPSGIAVSGTIAAAFAPFDVPTVKGSAVWEKVSGSVQLAGRFDRLDAFEHLVRHATRTRLEGGAGTATLEGKIQDGLTNGRLAAKVQNGVVHLAAATLQGTAALDGRIPRWNLAGGPLDISGTRLDLVDVAASGPEPARRWWGRFAVVSGVLDAESRLRIEAHCRDARPLLEIVGTNLPAWTAGLVELDDLSATAAISTAPGVFRVRDLDATGGGFRIRGEYARTDSRPSGAFLIESGILSLGLEIEPRGTRIRLLGARKWFEESVRASTGSSSAPSRSLR